MDPFSDVIPGWCGNVDIIGVMGVWTGVDGIYHPRMIYWLYCQKYTLNLFIVICM
jgi:hypothetical protein